MTITWLQSQRPSALQYGLLHHRGEYVCPDHVTSRRHVESVRDVKLISKLAIRGQHRRKDICKFHISDTLDVIGGEVVVFADLGEVLLWDLVAH